MNKKIIILILIVIGFLTVFLPKNPFSEKPVFFRVDKGQSSKEIALNLQEQDLIWWSPFFRLYVLTIGVADKLQAGTYQLSPSMNLFSISQRFASGDIAKEEITIIEGWNLRDIGFYFEKKGVFQAEELYDERADLEGYFFPDTYQIRVGASLDEIINQAIDNFNKKTANLEITPEIIVMASLLERELQIQEDKEIASGILWKRLKIGMPLQVNAEMWTYDNLGLPSKPICNPGLESIRAAVYPEDSEYWYYLSTPEGQTIFSKTLEEHNIAKAKYLK